MGGLNPCPLFKAVKNDDLKYVFRGSRSETKFKTKCLETADALYGAPALCRVTADLHRITCEYAGRGDVPSGWQSP